MRRPPPGGRAGAIKGAKGDIIEVYGFGVYAGPQPGGPIPFGGTEAELIEEWGEAEYREWRAAYTNPAIDLDDGRGRVWGCESWWGSEADIRARIELDGRTVVLVDPPTREVTG